MDKNAFSDFFSEDFLIILYLYLYGKCVQENMFILDHVFIIS